MVDKKRVVIVGAGFGGMTAAKKLAGEDVEVFLVDKRNHHLFQPLLYQVATADLSPAEIAWPVRSIFSRYPNVTVLMAEITGLDLDGQRVLSGKRTLEYDYLVLATGAVTSYFGNDHWAKAAPGLKSISEATDIRKNLLMAFERAEGSEDEEEKRQLLNFIVVGGGPTGVEMAGAIAELAKQALSNDFRRIDPRDARIILAEGGPRLLGAFPEDLSEYTKKSLEALGVEVRVGQQVSEITEQGAKIGDEFIPSANVIWGAGVQVRKLKEWTGKSADRGGRIIVEDDLSVPGLPNVFVIGDAAHAKWRDDMTVPGIAPAAKQQGKYVARRILDVMGGRSTPGFKYSHSGNLATIGRHRAVIDINGFKFKGWLAWWFWGLAHIYFLIGLRAPALVMVQWVWSYLFRKKGARLITGQDKDNARAVVSPANQKAG